MDGSRIAVWVSLAAGAIAVLAGCSDSESEATTYRWMWSVSGATAQAEPLGDGGFRVVVDEMDRTVLQFSNRPARAQEAVASPAFFSRWGKIFAGDPPNAVVAVQTPEGVEQWAITMTAPTFDDIEDTLTFTATELPHVDGQLRTGPEGLEDATNVTVIIDDSVLAGDPRFEGANSDVIQDVLEGPIVDISFND